MRLTNISLVWVVAGVVLLVGALAAVVVMTQQRKQQEHKENSSGMQTDSWEQLEARRRRKETVYATATYGLLFCCAAVAAALSFHGLVGFGRQNLRLSGGWEYLVPFGLDGAAMFSALIAVREASHGDASLGSRLLVWVFAGAAAWFNWVHAPRGVESEGAPQFFAGMSISAAILFDRALKQTRRSALREQGLVPRPLPQIRAVRWLRAPRETFRAWSLMLLEGVRTLDEAVEEVREEDTRKREQRKLERAQVRALNGPQSTWSWGRGARQLEMASASGATLGTKAGGGAGQAPLPTRPELQPAVEDGTASAARTSGEDWSRTVDTRKDGTQQGKGDGDDDDAAGNANPRLDSLEEKLAAIERQFG